MPTELGDNVYAEIHSDPGPNHIFRTPSSFMGVDVQSAVIPAA